MSRFVREQSLRALLSIAAAALSAAALAACSAQAAPEPSGTTDQPLGAGTAQDWSLLGNGQCLVAMQSFYPAKLGVGVPVARSAYAGSCAPEGACHVWLDDIPPPSIWERVPNDGMHSPEPYDLIVYPPVGKNPYGHIASVDHVDESGNIYVMDANWNGDERRSYAAHLTPGYTAYGWYHLRSLGPAGGACGGVGLPSSDCDHCCDADNPAPARTEASCGELARSLAWGDGAQCEWNGNGACNGVGPQTSDCDHCCVR